RPLTSNEQGLHRVHLRARQRAAMFIADRPGDHGAGKDADADIDWPGFVERDWDARSAPRAPASIERFDKPCLVGDERVAACAQAVEYKPARVVTEREAAAAHVAT